MGYYTYYNLSVDKKPEVIQELREENKEAREAIDPDGNQQEQVKWYDSDDDLREFSKKHPDILFTLNGVGEEDGDKWINYFKDGKMQKTHVIETWEEYDETKLV